MNYSKISKEILFENPNLIWNNRLSDHIANQIHKGTYQFNIEELDSLPEQIKHLHFLWRAQCEFGGSGSSYLYQANAQEIIGIYKALIAVQAIELLQILSNTIAVANSYETTTYFFEIKNTKLKTWFDQFTDKGKFDDLENPELMATITKLSTSYLDGKILKYIHQNSDTICE